MKNIFNLIGIFILFPNIVSGQNLINNPSFEDTIPCLTYPEPPQLRPYFWFWPTEGSSDFFNTSANCAWGGGIPQNGIGFQLPKTGNAYVGLGIWEPPPYLNWREYIEGVLIDSLKQNHTYCVEFYVSAANYCKYLTDDIGVFFSVDSITDYTNSFVLPYVPQVENTQGNILSDTLNWMLVSGTFVAQGGEKYMTIGNFKDDANTTLVTLPGAVNNFGYYYIDDVSVVDCTVGINEVPEIKFRFGPNPVFDKLYLAFENYKPSVVKISISDLIGQKVLEMEYSQMQKPHELNVFGLAGGTYFIAVQTNYSKSVQKFIKK